MKGLLPTSIFVPQFLSQLSSQSARAITPYFLSRHSALDAESVRSSFGWENGPRLVGRGDEEKAPLLLRSDKEMKLTPNLMEEGLNLTTEVIGLSRNVTCGMENHRSR